MSPDLRDSTIFLWVTIVLAFVVYLLVARKLDRIKRKKYK